MLHRELSMAWGKWQYEAAVMKAQKHAMGGAIRRLVHRKLSMAWEKWQYEAACMKAEKKAIFGAITRMLKRALSMAFEKWQFETEKALQERRAMRRALGRWIQGALARAFDMWRNGRSINQLELHARAAVFWMNRGLACGWNTWRETCSKNRGIWAIIHRLELKHRAEKDELLAEIERLRQMLSQRTYARPAAGSFMDDEDAKMFKAAKMWQNLALARGYNKMLADLRQARREKIMALKVLTFWTNQALVKAWNTWREDYFRTLAAKRAMGFWVNRAVAAAWNTWLNFIQELNRQKSSARNAIMRWRYMQLYAGFNTWRQSLLNGIRRKNAMLRAILRWGGSELLAGFGYWRETAEKIRIAELEFRAYLTKSYDPQDPTRSSSPTRRS